ncbi:hypothetical protein ACX9R5_07760 [Rathayibacter sp. CAU 1779]
MSDSSGVGEDALGTVDRKEPEEGLTGREVDDGSAASGRAERTAASPERSDTP